MLRLNLMPWREQRRARALRRFQLSIVASLIVALALMLLLDQSARSRLARQATATAQQQAALQHQESELLALGQLRDRQVQLRLQRDRLLQLRTAQSQLGQLLQGLERSMPTGAHLTELSLEEGKLRLLGVAASASVVAQLMRDLQALEVVRELELVHLRHGPSGDEFQLAARLPLGWS